MKINLLIPVTLLVLTFMLPELSAQKGILSTGGNGTGSGGSVSYSVGQLNHQSYNSPQGSIDEGLQQPYEITVISELEKGKNINLHILTYPNPASHTVTLEVTDYEFTELTCQLLCLDGRLLHSEKIISSSTPIAVSHLTPAHYIIKVISRHHEIKTFHLIKK